MTERIELAQNAAARSVPTMVNGKPQIPYLGLGNTNREGERLPHPFVPARIILKTATSA